MKYAASASNSIRPAGIALAVALASWPAVVHADKCRAGNLPQNIYYAGYTWDMFKADPEDLGRTAKATGIFELQPIHCVSGTTWYRPSGIQVTKDPAGKTVSKSRLMMTAWDYQQSASDSVSVGVGVPDVMAFTASASFSSFSSTSGSEMTFVSRTTQVRDSYETLIASGSGDDRLKLSQNFVDAVGALPTTYDAGVYSQFIQRWGTHYAKRVQMGGRALLTTDIVGSTFAELMGQKVDISAGASGSYEEFSGQASASSTSANTKSYKSLTKTTSKDLYYVGGTSPDSKAYALWDKSVDSDPVPIGLDLDLLDQLLVPEFFPAPTIMSATDLDQRRANLENAIHDYLSKGVPSADLSKVKVVYEYAYNFWESDANPDIRRYSQVPPEQMWNMDNRLWRPVGVPFLAYESKVADSVAIYDEFWKGDPGVSPWVGCFGRDDGSKNGSCHTCLHELTVDLQGDGWGNGGVAFYVPKNKTAFTVEVTQWQKTTTPAPLHCDGIWNPTQAGVSSYVPASAPDPQGWTKSASVFHGISSRVCLKCQ